MVRVLTSASQNAGSSNNRWKLVNPMIRLWVTPSYGE